MNSFFLTNPLNTEKNLDFNYQIYDRFHLDDIDPADCKAEFRVEKADVPRLVDALQLPDAFSYQQRSTEAHDIPLSIRRHDPAVWTSSLGFEFNNQPYMVDYIYETHGHLITQWNGNLLNPVALRTYPDYISRKGSPLSNCFGFIDGTIRPIARPGHDQRTVYNGHKRVHSLKSLAIDNGLIGDLYDPVGMFYILCLCLENSILPA